MKKRVITFALAGLMMMSPLTALADGNDETVNTDTAVEVTEELINTDETEAESAGTKETAADVETEDENAKEADDKETVTEGAELSKAYIKGYYENEFKPEFEVKRSELSAMIARKLGYKEKDAKYSDIKDKESHWAAGLIGALSDKEILTGYADGTFRPENSITRGELAKVLDTAYSTVTNKKIKAKTTELSDLEGHWAKQNIMNMEKIGVLKGHNDGMFKPEDFLTREEAVTAVNRFIRVVDNRGKRDSQFMYKVKNKFDDMSFERWSYSEVLEASTDYEYKKSGENEIILKTSDPKMGYMIDFRNNDLSNRQILIEVLNLKRDTNDIPEVVQDSKLDQLARSVAKTDAETLQKDGVTSEELKSRMDTLGITDKMPPQRGSLLFKTEEVTEAFASDILDDTLYASQFFRSFERIGISSSKSGDKVYTSLVIYMGFDQDSTALDHVLDKDEAVDIFKELKGN